MKALASVLLCSMVLITGCAGTSTKTSDTRSREGERTDPLYSLTLMRQGSVLFQQGEYQEALNRFTQADRIAPGNATIQNMIGLCHLKMDDHAQALDAFNRALDLIPSFTDARNNRGVTYLSLGQYRLAEVDFLAVLGDSTYPHRWEVYYNLGTTYQRRGQLAAAEENFRKALRAPKPIPDAYFQLADISHTQGRDQEAVDLLEEARLKFPDRTDVALALGRMLVEVGRTEEGRPYLEEVVAKEPGSERAREAEALLGGG